MLKIAEQLNDSSEGENAAIRSPSFKMEALESRREGKIACHCMKTQAHVKLKPTEKLLLKSEHLRSNVLKNVMLSYLTL